MGVHIFDFFQEKRHCGLALSSIGNDLDDNLMLRQVSDLLPKYNLEIKGHRAKMFSKHVFHEICIQGWTKVKANCPICRK
jgi:hypothetical protein